MKKNYLKTMLAAALLMAGNGAVFAQTTYFSQDYEAGTVDWTTANAGRFTPTILSEDTGNKYLSVDQASRYNNGTTISGPDLGTDIPDANFTLSFDLKFTSANNQNPVIFKITDKAGTGEIFSLSSTATYASTWYLNNNTDNAISFAGTAYTKNTIETLPWYTFVITVNNGLIYVTAYDKATSTLILDKQIVIGSADGGLGKMSFATKRYNANMAIDNVVVRSVESGDIPSLPSHNYTVNAVAGDKILATLATGSIMETSPYLATGIPEVYQVDGKFYRLSDTNVTDHMATFTMGTSDATVSVNYVEDANIANFIEVENYAKSTYVASDDRYSGGKSGYLQATSGSVDVPLNITEAGSYKITTGYYNDNLKARAFSIQLNDSEIMSALSVNPYTGGQVSQLVTLTGSSDVIKYVLVYSLTPNFDYVLVEKVAAPTVTIDATSQMASYSNTTAVTVPDDVTILIAKSADATNGVALYKVASKVIPANTGVILMSQTTGEKTLAWGGTAVTDDFTGNILKATGANAVVATGTEYALLKGEQAFAQVAADVAMPANKAYLTIDAAAAKLAINMGEATAINNVETNDNAAQPIYNVAGQQVNGSYKGLVIKGGKKFIQK